MNTILTSIGRVPADPPCTNPGAETKRALLFEDHSSAEGEQDVGADSTEGLAPYHPAQSAQGALGQHPW